MRRYIPPGLADDVLKALDSEFRVKVLEARFREHTETMDMAIKTLASHVHHLALQISIDHQHPESKE